MQVEHRAAKVDDDRTRQAEARDRQLDPHGVAPAGQADEDEPLAWPSSDRQKMETTTNRTRNAWLVSNAALLTYVIPMSFLAIPFYRVMQIYGLADHPLAVIFVEVTFATPYAIFIFQQGTSIPLQLDEAARIDGATPWHIYWRVYLPLMAPAMVAVGTEALLLAWKEYLFLLLSSEPKHDRAGCAGTVPQQRRGAVEPDDGNCHHLRPAADRHILCVWPPHEFRPDDGRVKG